MGWFNKWIRCEWLKCWLWWLLLMVVEESRGGWLVAMVKVLFMYYEDFLWNNSCEENHNGAILNVVFFSHCALRSW